MTFVAAIIYQLFPFPWLLRAQHLLSKPSKERDARAAAWTGLSRARLLELLDGEWDRAKALDEKLFKLTAVLTVAVTAASAVARPLLDNLAPSPLRLWIFGLLLYAILHLFIGTLMGFSGLRPKERAGYGPDFALSVQRPGKPTALRLAEALKHYEVKNLLRSNEAVTANMAIRNGVVAFALAMMLSLVAPGVSRAPLQPPPSARLSVTIGWPPAAVRPDPAAEPSQPTRTEAPNRVTAPIGNDAVKDR